jgi:hypothetical protein
MMSFGVAGTWLLIPEVLHEALQSLSSSPVSSLLHLIHYLKDGKYILKFHLLIAESIPFNPHDTINVS